MHCVFDVQATKGTPKPKVCRTPQEMAEEVKKSMKSVCAVSESMQSLWGAHHVRQCAWLMRLFGNGASSAYGMSLWHPNPLVAHSQAQFSTLSRSCTSETYKPTHAALPCNAASYRTVCCGLLVTGASKFDGHQCEQNGPTVAPY